MVEIRRQARGRPGHGAARLPRVARGLDLTTSAGTGMALGNAPRVRGVRINLRDRRVDWVEGLNLTLWKAGANDGDTPLG